MEPIKEITFEKTYNASLEAVWQAWTNPAMLKQWWGPQNVTIPECEVEDMAAFEKMMNEYMTMKPEDKAKMAGYADMYLTGRREIYRIWD